MLFRHGKVAICQRKETKTFAGYHQFPGGTVNPEEHHACTAQRELWEECGLDIEMFRFHYMGSDERTKPEHYLGHEYIVFLNEGEEPLNKEPDKHTDWEWVSLFDAYTMRLIPGTEQYLKLIFQRMMYGFYGPRWC